ncbi:iron-dicitrate ABC transporter ATP-binding protein [Weizmannia acidilactici]|jgi:iron complex transport system ATP-binding protein|uniref:Iron-dicitrate ABC transporter ATP-binding protein n=1 Tax=Weizmannia acidilactici TaxID=2607726 RepID=A0A5J4JH33_9BACI|nr:ABC transporter ATP-binding protein [Weizmannia acidilactici]GER66639.1 iron-dicitrate ABC transporter ATP-binding protein [Weizmannia acidilactici]GER70639.1 iron-dicitrate ABC transporter ATP-binding protein [Weizmannia acidilactici]GER72799.1 iron-dicitrate ABC transporter ATP-binding protein [Weizmannia acidilactici]
MPKLHADGIRVAYGETEIIKNISLEIPDGKITAIIGPNGCGKSTLLKTLGRILFPNRGAVYLDGKEVVKQSTKKVAQKLAMLPQSPDAPEGLSVSELVSFGRYPHQKGLGKLKAEDHQAVSWALQATGMLPLKDREVDALSGGQRQRAWIAMALAQGTDIILLDEPTTYLDLSHQLEVLKLLQHLNRAEHRTIVMVIHDLNQAARFSDYMVAMKDGEIYRHGSPETVMTRGMMRDVFQIDAEIALDRKTGKPVCLSYDLAKEYGQAIEKMA